MLAAAQADAPWALQRLYEDLAPAVTGYLRLRGAQEPDDLASEAFLSVFRNVTTFTGNEPAFRSWVFTIAHRRLVDERRRQRRRPDIDVFAELPSLAGGDVETEAFGLLGSAWVRDVLEELTPEQRDVVLLRVLGDLSVDEVASIVGKRPGAVRALQHRGLDRLRGVLAAQRAVMSAPPAGGRR
ncbi:MAG: RNA polymerase sigma factor [Nitriliruptoraceae bacterium]